MNILGIETSCDETAIAIVKDGTHILSNIVVSQVDIFANYGGVIPEIAARSHLEAILPAVDTALRSAHCSWHDIDAIAVTHTPGLFGSLLIGTLTARTLAIIHHKPLYPVHHLKSHIYSTWLTPPTPSSSITPPTTPKATPPSAKTSTNQTSTNQTPTNQSQITPSFPLIALLISGGHTQLIHMTRHNHFQIIGTTRDDAVGECFDKIAKILGLPYPGGPAISRLALQGDPHKYPLPHPKVPDLDFSFSGLKTAVLRSVQKTAGVKISTPSHTLAPLLTDAQRADFAASFQQTAIDILLEKLQLALKIYPATSIVFAGGVSANSALRTAAFTLFTPQSPSLKSPKIFKNLQNPSKPFKIHQNPPKPSKNPTPPTLFFPAPSLSGDNGAMVASAAFFEIHSGVNPTDPASLRVSPTSPIT